MFSWGIEYKNVYPPRIRSKNITLYVAIRFNAGPPFKLLRFPNPVAELRNILIKSMRIEVVAKNHLQPPKTKFLPKTVLKSTI